MRCRCRRRACAKVDWMFGRAHPANAIKSVDADSFTSESMGITCSIQYYYSREIYVSDLYKVYFTAGVARRPPHTNTRTYIYLVLNARCELSHARQSQHERYARAYTSSCAYITHRERRKRRSVRANRCAQRSLVAILYTHADAPWRAQGPGDSQGQMRVVELYV